MSPDAIHWASKLQFQGALKTKQYPEIFSEIELEQICYDLCVFEIKYMYRIREYILSQCNHYFRLNGIGYLVLLINSINHSVPKTFPSLVANSIHRLGILNIEASPIISDI